VSTVRPARTSAPAVAAAVPASAPTFTQLGVPAPLVDSLARDGIVTAFPIQAATLPDSLAGRDVLGRGRTGSGKTVAYALPLVVALAASGKPRRASRPRALVLLPTRELASQVAATITPLAAAMGLNVTTIFGGVGQNPQVSALRAGVDVLVACPGRLEDLIGQGHVHLDAVEVTVLDEADHMADLGFLPGVKRLLDRTPRGTQRLLFSATLDNGIDVIVKRYLSDPVTHSVATPKAAASDMTHYVLAVDSADKAAVVRELAGGQNRSLLFMRTKHTAKKLARQLTAAGIPAVDLHGNLSQNARERHLAAFSDGSVRVMVATDIAARGIHVDDVNLVVHVDPPAEHKAYTHRSGRTARAGAHGVVITVMTPDQRGDVRTLTRQAGITPIQVAVVPGGPLLHDLAGPQAPRVEPAPEPVAASQPRSGGRRRGSSRPGSTSGHTSARQPADRPASSRQGGSRSAGGRQAAQPAASGYHQSNPRGSGAGQRTRSRRRPV
jgi:superfamily II DNA/RNA helicase